MKELSIVLLALFAEMSWIFTLQEYLLCPNTAVYRQKYIITIWAQVIQVTVFSDRVQIAVSTNRTGTKCPTYHLKPHHVKKKPIFTFFTALQMT